jgi:hypothetical protein
MRAATNKCRSAPRWRQALPVFECRRQTLHQQLVHDTQSMKGGPALLPIAVSLDCCAKDVGSLCDKFALAQIIGS